MPDGLEAWGCDDLLWTQIPPGAKRDLTRFARDGVEELARNRLQTMREVISFVDAADDAPWEKGPWDTAVITWRGRPGAPGGRKKGRREGREGRRGQGEARGRGGGEGCGGGCVRARE